MQQTKSIKFKGELTTLLNQEGEIESKLESVMSLFAIKNHLSAFNALKTRGYNLSDLMSFLILMPFHGASNVFNLSRLKITTAKKDAYYTAKKQRIH